MKRYLAVYGDVTLFVEAERHYQAEKAAGIALWPSVSPKLLIGTSLSTLIRGIRVFELPADYPHTADEVTNELTVYEIERRNAYAPKV